LANALGVSVVKSFETDGRSGQRSIWPICG